MTSTEVDTNQLNSNQMMVAETLLSMGNDVDTVANLLRVDASLLKPFTAKAEAMVDLKKGYEAGSPEETFGDWCRSFLDSDYPDNPLELNTNKPFLSVAGIARREGWHKGPFKSTTSTSAGTGRPRVDNAEDKLAEAAKRARSKAEDDKRKNLKLCVIEAMAEVGVTDLNGVVAQCQSIAPQFWKPRG